MPTKNEHLQKAEGNARFAQSLELTSQPSIDWALVALFYAALHLVEAYLADSGQHLKSHQTRDNVVARDSNLRPIFRQYSDLKYFAYAARYEMIGFTATDVAAKARPALEAVAAQIRRLV